MQVHGSDERSGEDEEQLRVTIRVRFDSDSQGMLYLDWYRLGLEK